MVRIGKGVREIRISSEGQYRVIYLTSNLDQTIVLHAFVKKSRTTRKEDIEKARTAFKTIMTGKK